MYYLHTPIYMHICCCAVVSAVVLAGVSAAVYVAVSAAVYAVVSAAVSAVVLAAVSAAVSSAVCADVSAAVAHYCASVDSRCPICCLGTCLLQGVIGRLSICFLAAVRLNPFIPIHFVYFPMTGGPPRSAVKNWVNQQVHEQKRCSVPRQRGLSDCFAGW